MASVRQLARQTGVSITTVSRVLNNHPSVSEAVRRRVLDAANHEGYVATVGRRSTSNIAVLYTEEPSIGSPFDAALLTGLTEAMRESPFDLMILEAERSRRHNETFSQMLMRKGVRGAIVRTSSSTHGIAADIADEGCCAVVVGARIDHPRLHYVYSDSRRASREAVEHLIGLGHRRIAISLNVIDDTDHQDRLDGCREALAAAGLTLDERLVFHVPARRQGGNQIIRRLRTMVDPPTALYLTDPMTAVGAVHEAQRVGLKVPGDLSIVGFDDADMRFTVHPQLTAVCQDAIQLGREAFAILNDLTTRKRRTPIRKALRTWLEVHGSTGPPPSNGRPPQD